MPSISSIIYEAAEDLNKYLYDNYYSVSTLETFTTLTGYIRSKIFEMALETGVTANSVAMINYSLNYFNPIYSEATWKCFVNDPDDCFIFFGFKETLTEPTYNMVESHTGFMIHEGRLYASVADGTTQQKVEIIGIDLERVQNYRINYYRFSIQPLPKTETQLGLPEILSVERVWKEIAVLSNFPPKNQVHYMVQYIKNFVGADKIIKFNRFIYKEVYAD